MNNKQYLAQVNKYIKKWQPRLGLSDYVIHRYIDNDIKALGDVYYQCKHKSATIRISRVQHESIADNDFTYDGMLLNQLDLEFTVLHEIVHIKLGEVEDNETSETVLEQTVNSITRALLWCDRQKDPYEFMNSPLKDKKEAAS